MNGADTPPVGLSSRILPSSLHVRFNWPLAEQLRPLAPESVRVATFHELAIAQWRKERGEPDFADPGLLAQCRADADLDLLVVDETQDLDAAWIDVLLRSLRHNGRTYLLGDEDQRLVDNRAAWSDPACVRIRCPDNFRNPRTIAALQLSSQPITPRCPVDGDVPGFHVWDGGDGGVQGKTVEVVDNLLAKGVQGRHIAVLSLRGIESSLVLQQLSLGALPLKRFTGHYDASGHAIWSEGTLPADTVHRFKGQAAPVVVLTEMDFDTVDDRLRRRLFVGMTRAQWRLECVMSPGAQIALVQILEA